MQLTRETSLTLHTSIVPAACNTTHHAPRHRPPSSRKRSIVPNRLGLSCPPPSPPPQALASSAVQPLHQRIASTGSLSCLPTIAHSLTTSNTTASQTNTLTPPSTTAPPRPRATMGSYTFRWYVVYNPALPPARKDASSASEPRRVRAVRSSWRPVELSPSRLLGRAVLPQPSLAKLLPHIKHTSRTHC